MGKILFLIMTFAVMVGCQKNEVSQETSEAVMPMISEEPTQKDIDVIDGLTLRKGTVISADKTILIGEFDLE